MPTIRVDTATAFAAGATAFPLVGNQYEFLPFNALVEFAIVSIVEAATVNLQATVYSGSDVLQQQGPISAKAGHIPVYPDDFLLNDTSLRGDRLSVIIQNLGTTATTAPISTAVRITPA
jgi:hypothetical protein